MPSVPDPQEPPAPHGWVFLFQPQEAMAAVSLLSELIKTSFPPMRVRERRRQWWRG